MFAAGDGLPGDFVFDDSVAEVFDDMINRSVPGYGGIIAMLELMAERYGQPGSAVYDLGCSLGAASLAMARGMARRPELRGCSIHAVDNSPAMLAKLQERLQQKLQERPQERPQEKQHGKQPRESAPASAPAVMPIVCHCADINDFPIADASIVALNFTLQFIPVARRAGLMERIQRGMRPGGMLLLSEKIRMPDPQTDELFIGLYHRFKESMGYSKLEISRKRAALENVLIPETLDTHRARLINAGFETAEPWFQCFNFVSIVAFKGGQPPPPPAR